MTTRSNIEARSRFPLNISEDFDLTLSFVKTNIGGKAKGDVKQLKSVKAGAPIKVEKVG
jgi:hypothetical protein